MEGGTERGRFISPVRSTHGQRYADLVTLTSETCPRVTSDMTNLLVNSGLFRTFRLELGACTEMKTNGQTERQQAEN